jgi:hypothetical protein
MATVDEICLGEQVDALRPFCHEILFRAFSRPERKIFSGRLVTAGYELQRGVTRWRVTSHNAAKQEELAERKLQLVSPTASAEWSTGIAPRAKVRALRNGIESRNRIGRLSDDENFFGLRQIVSLGLSYNRKGLKLADAFLALNESWSAGHILKVMEACASLEREAEDDGFDPLWHARKGRGLTFLVEHIDDVLDELGRVSDFPPIIFSEEPPDKSECAVPGFAL